MKKVLFICPYPTNLAPSQRFRYEQYLDHLKEKSFDVNISPFLTEKAYRHFYQSGNLFSKIYSITVSYITRALLLLKIPSYDFVFIHREATPAGPPVVEYVIAKIFRKKIIYDFDDAIWLTDKQNESGLTKLLKCRWKVSLICRWSYVVSCGNTYLADYVRQFNPKVFLNPTTIDTNLHIPEATPSTSDGSVTIGWTGSHSTLKYLTAIVPALEIIEQKYPQVAFLVIADRQPQLPLKNLVFRPWSLETEISDLAAMDIGIMPLPDDPWARGKCGFKALQYMAMGIPAVISPVGLNKEIVQHGVEGYWCSTAGDWVYYLEELILDRGKRIEMGKRGRQTVHDRYSVESNSANFLSLFQQA